MRSGKDSGPHASKVEAAERTRSATQCFKLLVHESKDTPSIVLGKVALCSTPEVVYRNYTCTYGPFKSDMNGFLQR